jgi:hypothetical protein
LVGGLNSTNYCPVASGTSFGRKSAAVTSCDAVCIRLLVRANRTSPIAIPTKNTAMNPTPIMPPFRGGLRLNPRSCWSKSSWSRWFIFQIFENDPYEMGGKRCPGSASMVRGSGLSIRRSGDEIPCQRFLQGCQRPGFPHPPAHQIAVSVSSIHWFSDTSTPPRMETLHDGERGPTPPMSFYSPR